MFMPKLVYIRESLKDHYVVKRILNNLNLPQVLYFRNNNIAIEENVKLKLQFKDIHKIIILDRYEREIIRKEKYGMMFSRQNAFIASIGYNCPFMCEYCYLLANFKHRPYITVMVEIEKLLNAIETLLVMRKGQETLINIGEESDSLALDHITEFSKDLVMFFADKPNAKLELRTKSNNISNLIDLEHKGKTIIAFSMNPQEVISKFEHGTASLYERIDASLKLQENGYKIALKFEPIIAIENWEEKYSKMVDQIFKKIDPSLIDHFALGTIRFRDSLAELYHIFYHNSSILKELSENVQYNEKITNLTYSKELRKNIYHYLLNIIREYLPKTEFYLSVETKEMYNEFCIDFYTDSLRLS